MQPQVSTHASLLIRLREGHDSVAWGEFHRRYSELLIAFAKRRGLQAADAEDVAQETLHAIARGIPEFAYDPGRGRFRNYLKTVAIRAIWRRMRDNAAAPQPLDDGNPTALDSDAAVENEWEAEWRQHHLRLAMTRVRQEFNRTDLEAFEAVAGTGREAASVAAELGLSVDQVYKAKSRIIQRLKALVAEQTNEEG